MHRSASIIYYSRKMETTYTSNKRRTGKKLQCEQMIVQLSYIF